MKSGFDRIGHTVTVETAKKGCFDKRTYDNRNIARDASRKIARNRPEWPPLRPYRCTLCGNFHLTSQVPNGLKDREGKPPTKGGRKNPPAKHYQRLPEEG